MISRAEHYLRASQHAEAAALIQRSRPAQLPAALLDRALPTLLMAVSVDAGEFEARRVFDAIAEATENDAARGILDTYRAEAALDPEQRATLARAALGRLDDDAPVSRHRALAALLMAELDLGRGLDETLLDRMAAQESHLELTALVDSALAQRGFFSYQVGKLDESRTALRALVRSAHDDGQPFIERVFRTHLATVDIYAGRLDTARRALDDAARADAGAASMFPAEARARGLLAIRTGDEETLQAVLLEPTLQGSEAAGEFSRAALTGLAAAVREDWREAYVQLARAREMAEGLGLHEPGRRLWIDFDLARAAVECGLSDEAVKIADRLEEIAKNGRPLLTGLVQHIRGLVESSVARLEGAVAVLAGAGFPDQHALTLLALGRAYTAAGQAGPARRALDRADLIVRRTGDIAIGRLVAAALSAVSSEGRLAMLTTREREVAQAAAAGASSRQIASSSFTSIRTVESQLSSVYRKLGVHSRTQLAALLADGVRGRATLGSDRAER